MNFTVTGTQIQMEGKQLTRLPAFPGHHGSLPIYILHLHSTFLTYTEAPEASQETCYTFLQKKWKDLRVDLMKLS